MRRTTPVVGLLAGGLLAGSLTACAPADDVERLDADDGFLAEQAVTSTTVSETPDDTLPPPAGEAVELDVELPRRVPAAGFVWPIELVNDTDAAVTVTFGSSQQVEIVLERNDEVVHTWSDGRFFAQALTSITVPADESVTLEIPDDLSGLEPGFYDVTITLTNTDPPEPLTTDIRIVSPPED